MDRIAVIRRESDRLAEVLAGVDPAAAVPTCPGWDASDLLWHFTGVHLFWAGVLGSGARTEEEVGVVDASTPDRPADLAGLLGLRERATLELLAQLESLGDDEPRWTWWDEEQTVGFTRRMQTYEATMHRVDAERTAGAELSPIPPDVAAGAVDHCVDVMWAGVPEWAHDRALAHVEIVASETGDRWLVEVGRWSGTGPESGRTFDEPRARRLSGEIEPGMPRATVTGTVQDLALWAWGRGDAVTVQGPEAAVRAVTDLAERGIN
ncbi:maleylpyruvate isomerase family mycothiol-dependent enzyme [Ornithinimicrobium tianjinense]|uniref:TIGR03083 family protein n=1 Tax=Ornithinimicrobium tianjinense TaxID=1195761 RepID=A0A917BL63_9MICO|nr:maleylpyruvate isomerase family mycothiol-dependent enzyme [Ornithinimicrobium tianjinense]GGF47743.1 hypothetical protein GCM10011366_14460 [Ornithinimicrobium tianjinense]